TSTLMNVIFKNKGDFYKFYKSNKDNDHVKNFNCINERIQSDLDFIINQVEYDSIDSQLLWDKEKAEFEIKEGINGIMVNRNELIENLYRNLGKETQIELPTEKIPQSITKHHLEKRCKQRGEFSTSFKTSSQNRKHNIKVATNRLNGLQVASQQVISFNDVVGPRTIANGFLESRIISGGVFVEGVGGGVCQVSTTLFNAWMRAGLEVVNATSHSLKVSYVPPSMDAMVSSRTDLTLKNNSEYDVFIKAYTKEDSLFIIIYGYEMQERIELRNEIIKIIYCNEYDEVEKEDIEWEEEEQFRVLSPPKNGLVSNAYKDVYKGSRLISSTKIRTNTYLAQKGKIVRRKSSSDTEERENKEKKSTIYFGDNNPFSCVFDGITFLKYLVS
ncbi:MAG: VanW family protein, partial [Bacillota bacterium]